LLNTSGDDTAQHLVDVSGGSFGIPSEVGTEVYGEIPYDASVVKADHRVETASLIVNLVEGLTFVIVPMLLLGALLLGSSLFIPVNILLGVILSLSYSSILDIPYKLRTAIVGIFCTIVVNLLLLTIQNVDFNQKVVGELTGAILFIFCMGFINEMLKKDRNMLIRSITNTVSLEVFVSSFCGYFLVSKLFSGVFAGYIVLTLIPLVVVGLICSVLAGVEHFTSRSITKNVRIRIQVCVYSISVCVFYYLLPTITDRFIIRPSYMVYTLTLGILTLCVTNAQFQASKSISGALTRGLFPICLLGIATYIICIAVQ
jgi:hypothetical protein